MRNWSTPSTNCCHGARTHSVVLPLPGEHSQNCLERIWKTKFCQIYRHIAQIFLRFCWEIRDILSRGAGRWNPEWLETAQVQSGRLYKRAWLQFSVYFVSFPSGKAAPTSELSALRVSSSRRFTVGVWLLQTLLPQRVWKTNEDEDLRAPRKTKAHREKRNQREGGAFF